MKFFIDTANLEQIREANALGVLDGVTTNPSLMAKEGIKGVENQHKHYIEICNIVDGDVSAEVIATNYEGMIKEGEELAALNPHIVVKVPCIEDGIKAIKYFSNKGIRTNCTLVFSAGQALLAAKKVLDAPFIVINADDYYGKKGFKVVHEYLINGGRACMSGFVLKNTISQHGGVTRGICKMDTEHNLTEIIETKNIVKVGDRVVVFKTFD